MIYTSKIGDSENAVALVDSRYPWRWLDAWGSVDKFVLNTYNTGDWTVTATGTSPVANSLLPDAKILITTGGTEYDGDNMQVLGSKFKLEAGKPLYFGIKATANQATQNDFLVGLCGVDTTLTNASSSHAIAVGAGGAFFSKLDGVTAGYVKTYTTATEANTASAFTLDTSAHWYEFSWDGYTLTARYDSNTTPIASFNSGITTEVLTPSICYRAGDANARTLTIHELICIAVRG